MPSDPIQPRARRTRENLLQALENLLKHQDFDQISVADIAKEAGVSVGTVYGHFKDKEAFLTKLLDRHHEQLKARLADTEGGGDAASHPQWKYLRDALRAAVSSALAQIEHDAHILRALALIDPATAESGLAADLLRSAQSRTQDFLAPFEADISAMSLPEAAKITNWMLNNLFYRRAITRHSEMAENFDPPDAQIVTLAADMLYAVLTTKSTAYS